MGWEPIRKASRGDGGSALGGYDAAGYDAAAREFSWDQARRELTGLPGGRGLNIAYEAVDRHLAGPRAGATALRCLAADGRGTELTYAELARQTSRFANLLRSLGVGKGDRVFTLLGRVPELYISVLGTLKNTSVASPLFPAFGPEPIRDRLRLGDARVLVTSASLYARKIAPIRAELPALAHVLTVGEPPDAPVISLADSLAAASEEFEIPPTDPEDMALLYFTSGTTGKPKGAVHVHEAVVAHHATAAFALDLRPGDVFWCTADPGWVTGTSYGIIAPLTHGLTVLADAGEFDARRWYRHLSHNKVMVWYTAPTALRMLMLMRHGQHLAGSYDLSSLRFVASVGRDGGRGGACRRAGGAAGDGVGDRRHPVPAAGGP